MSDFYLGLLCVENERRFQTGACKGFTICTFFYCYLILRDFRSGQKGFTEIELFLGFVVI